MEIATQPCRSNVLIIVLFCALSIRGQYFGPSDQPEAYFNGTSYVRLQTTISLKRQTGLSFRTCTGGELLSQQLNENLIELSVHPEGLKFIGKTAGKLFEETISGDYLNNKWHVIYLVYRLGNLTLSLDDKIKLLSNASYRPELLNSPGLYNEGAVLIIGKHYNGCILEGPSITFNKTVVQPHNVQFGKCPILDNCNIRQEMKAARAFNYCNTEPCMMHGVCVNEENTYSCKCSQRYTGKNCEIDLGNPCEKNPMCKNGASCVVDYIGNFKCNCAAGFTGKYCETDIKTHPLCVPNPCLNSGYCQITKDDSVVECVCPPGFVGLKCEININECQPNPCKNGGVCQDGANNYTCDCAHTGYKGPTCEENINECLKKPCQNRGICYDTYGSYICECMPGFDGRDCEIKLNECMSQPCQNHAKCEDKMGGFECHCMPGFGGQLCEFEMRKASCDPSLCGPYADCKEISGVTTCTCKPEYGGVFPNCGAACPPGYTGTACEQLELCDEEVCQNGGTCDEGVQCLCRDGYTGQFCERALSCEDNPCLHALVCKDYKYGYYCNCETGWGGINCDQNVDDCYNKPCLNGATCIDLMDNFKCQCLPGFIGERCQINVDDCAKMPCQNGGTCTDEVNGFKCNCTEQWMGVTCERQYNACELKPCLHNSSCILASNMHDYTCKCLNGYEGKNCEININDCLGVTCPPGKVCIDLIGAYDCQCPIGYTGETCTVEVDPCIKEPCKNNAQCVPSAMGHNYTCVCPPGFKGTNCNMDINECELPGAALCNHGICVNNEGSFQCYCMPGYTGERCDLDFDECLSQPCRNNATCINKINNYECICPPGYEGKDCNINIDECESNPCMEGSTCVDGINEFSCICQAGLAGKQCEINIDDCMSAPCQNKAQCIDGLNMYTCDCTDTGYRGTHCEINIDDCVSNPCENGAECVDEVKDYHCNCFNGYTGKNCQEDINECESNPCQFNGICLERSNLTLYQPNYAATLNITLPAIFKKPFDYYEAAGYECLCVPGVVGPNCDININECESQPCIAGNCFDKVGGYFCECDEGFEGEQCEIDIDECEKFTPCIHGTCIDKRASYFCECEQGFGGKNCSVELTGCHENPCQNNGTCKPYLDNETLHKFNCTCPHGFHGSTCDRVTTMSLSGKSLMVINTSRDEGHDIQFRFKTTLGDGFLALGKGSTYYILSLAKGRLNLHSSLLNKWDGVFVGSNLNDSNWQRVFVAINSSHLVLSANDEQTIYPINYNDNNGSSTSFPTTYIGGYPNNHRKLTHVQPFLVGCVEDVIVNSEWVLPDTQNSSWVGFQDVGVGCHRESQCDPNPCYSGGHCTDLWSNFSCSCERPYLGYTCEYNYTAATFGYENITDSLVTVAVTDAARRAVRSIVDISMFIRTRQPRGQIFYLGSALGSANLQNESYIAAQLEGGELLVRIQFNGTFEGYTVGGVRLNNGYNHLIQVIRNVTLVQVKLNGTEYFRKTISATGTLDAQVLFLGGQPQLRPVRQTSEVTIQKSEVAAATGPAAVTTPLSMIHFKGIIQDVQISDGSKVMVVEFFPLQAEELSIPMSFGNVSFDNNTVHKGVQSDNTCNNKTCHHNGHCHITWNDFRCDCQRGFKGKDCQELEFCELEHCPLGSSCRNLEDGYECVANTTFNGEMQPLMYNLSISSASTKTFQADVLELMYRTRSWGTALFIKHSTNYFIIFIYHEWVVVEFKINGLIKTEKFRIDHFDGQWVTLYFKYKDAALKGGFKEHVIDDTPDFTVNEFDLNGFTEIITKGLIYVGGSDNKTFDYWSVIKNGDYNVTSYVTLTDTTTLDPSIVSNSVDFVDTSFPSYKVDLNKSSDLFKGCLSEIRIGKLLLPYFTTLELYPNSKASMKPPQKPSLPEEYFQLLQNGNKSLGCQLCYDKKDCFNAGKCIDPDNTYKCECPPGFAADDCSIDINECEDHKCQNNATCIDQIGKYECECVLGYDGDYCEHEIDECESSPCHNGGTCVDLLGTFRCECLEDYVGRQCEALRLITCENQPCKEGSQCENVKNEQTQNNFTCICTEGMVGTLCDTPYCAVKTKGCENRGLCNTSRKVPICDCILGFEGRYCETNIDDCLLPSGESPCQNGGQCIDGINEYECDCLETGYTGSVCDIDINECNILSDLCGGIGTCINTPGSYRCNCPVRMCGNKCDLDDPCILNPCEHGSCRSECKEEVDYECDCEEGWGGKNCTEDAVQQGSQVDDGINILYIVIPIVVVILVALAVGLAVLVNVARSKRATRGTYSPSAQEFCNPRVELDHVLKPPPEERLI